MKTIRKIGRFMNDKALALGVLAVLMFFDCKSALAQGGLGDLGENVASNMSGLAKGAQYGAFFIGLVSFIAGIFEFKGVGHKQGCTVGGGVLKCGVGVCLLGLGAFLTASSTTIFGTDESSGMGELGL